MPARLDFVAWRNADWRPAIAIGYSGDALPLDGARIAMQLRLYQGAADPALLTCPGLEWLDAATPSDADPAARTITLYPNVAQASISSLPGINQPEAGDELVCAHDIRITYGDGVTELLAYGCFTVYPGVTTI